MSKITDKQERFIQELIKGKSQREAYRTAYPNCKASNKTVDEMASKLIHNDKVNTRYNEIHDRLIKEAEDECIITAKEVLRELKRIGKADIKKYLSYKTVKTVVGHDEETDEPIIDYAPVIELIDSDSVDGRAIQEVSISSKGVFTFKLYDKLSALDKLGKHLGLFTEKVELGGCVETINPYNELTVEELKALARKCGSDECD
ncbi:MAG: terminase small subunit [Oscillospiraceae bacterium]